MTAIEESAGYKSLLAAVERDEGREAGRKRFAHDYRGKLAWAVARAEHYAEKTGLSAAEILDAWEDQRNYWYMNFYREARQPEIKGDRVRVFENIGDLLEAVSERAFRCPSCAGVSTDPYACTQDECDWKAYGLLGTLGKGVHVFVKEKVRAQEIFMPIAWEDRG